MKIDRIDWESLPSKFKGRFKKNFFNKEEREQTVTDN
jgi:hypothetical protein